MKKLLILLIACAMASPALAEDSLKQDLKDAWQATKREVKKAGNVVEDKVEELTGKTSDAQPDANKVAVNLDESGITMPGTLDAGRTSFIVTNSGTESHSFEISGQGKESELSKTLKPGETATLTTTLKPGVYNVECPISGHDAQGMKRTIDVR